MDDPTYSKLGLSEGFSQPTITVDTASSVMLVRLTDRIKPRHGAYWYRRFDEETYTPLCGNPPGPLDYGDAAFFGPDRRLAVNVMEYVELPRSEGGASGDWNWHGLSIFDLARGETRTLGTLDTEEDVEHVWISAIFEGVAEDAAIVGKVGFEYPSHGGAYVRYRLCRIDVESGRCTILTEMKGVFV